jgi:hypothetical protein
MCAGMPTVSSGSQIVTFGIMSGWKITFLVCVASCVITPARPTSEPVPAVVGTATTGAMPAGSARVHQSPMSSKSHMGRVWPAMKAITLPASSAEPPPKATTPSCPPPRMASRPAAMLLSTGLGLIAENSAAPSPASFKLSSACWVIGCVARNGSVTRSGRVMPELRQASASSAMRPAPKRMAVG